MAKLVDYSTQQRPAPRIGARASVAPIARGVAVGSAGPGLDALGGSLIKGGNEIYRAQIVEQDRVDNLRAEEAYNTFLTRQMDLTMGEDGYKHRKGADAVNYPTYDNYSAKLVTEQRSISSELSNDTQRAAFGARADVAQLHFKEGLLRHTAEQTTVHATAVHEGTLATAAQTAIAGAANPVDVEAAQLRIKNSVSEQADLHGWPADYHKATLLAEQSKVYEGVINNLIDTDPTEARDRYENHYKKKIDASRYDEIERALKTSGLKEFSQGASDAIVSKIDDQASEEDFLQQSKVALAEAKNIKDAERRDATEKRVRSEIDTMTTMRSREKAARGDAGWETVLNGGNLDSLPVTLLDKLRETDSGTVKGMETYISNREKGVDAVTNWSRYTILSDMASGSEAERREFAGLDLRKDLGSLAPTQYGTMTSLQRSTRASLGVAETKDATLAAKRATYENARSVSKDLLQSAGFDMTPDPGSAEAERLAKFYDALFVEIEAEQQLQQGKMSEQQIRETSTRLLKLHEDKYWGDDVLAFEAPIDELHAAIPTEERQRFEAALVARGQSMSRENVVHQWQRVQRRERAKAARAVEMIRP